MVYGGAPATVPNDELKFLVGDTSTSAAGTQLSSAECSYLIGVYGSAKAASPAAARALAAKFADECQKQVGDLQLWAQQKFEHYTTLSQSLEQTAALRAVPYAGGISQADKTAVKSNTDRTVPSFTLGSMDNKLAGPLTNQST